MLIRSALLGAALVVVGAGAAVAQGPDGHFISPGDEYFVANQEYESGWQYVTLARMLQPASDATRGEAHFLAVSTAGGGDHPGGQRFWSRYFWRTRMATPQDAVVGKVVFVLDATGDGGVYRPPASRDEALRTNWFMGTITDVSEMYKQQAQVGDYKVNVNALRVAQ